MVGKVEVGILSTSCVENIICVGDAQSCKRIWMKLGCCNNSGRLGNGTELESDTPIDAKRSRSTHCTRGSVDVMLNYTLIMDVIDYPWLSRA